MNQTFLLVAGIVTALLLPALVFLQTMEQKLAGFVAILVIACGIAALVVKLKKRS